MDNGNKSKIKPLYPSADYEVFCKQQKAKGLKKTYWKDLPKMWEEELAFRQEFEDAINGAVDAGKIKVIGISV